MRKAILFVLLISVVACSKDPGAERDKYFASGQKYLEEGKYEEATIQFRNALQIDKGHLPSYFGIAKAFRNVGNHQGAVATYQEITKIDNKNVPARIAIGEYLILAATRDHALFKQAQRLSEEALALDPGNAEALILLGNAYSGQGEVDKALPLYEKVLGLDPANLKAMLNLAAVQLRKGDASLAEETLNKALQQHPRDIQVHLAMASFYAATQKPQETERYLKTAFDLAPTDSRSLFSLANYYVAAKRTAEAEEVFRQAIARKPADREPRWGLADFYLKQGRVDAAIEELKQLLGIKKGDRAALLRLAEIYISRNEDAKADEAVQTVLSANRNDAGAHFLKGRMLRKGNEFDKAISEFDAAVQSDPMLLPALMEKSNILLMQGDLAACEVTLQDVLKRNRNYLPGRGAYAKLLAVRQRPKEALQQAQEVLAELPNNEDALGARAEAFRISGRLEESRKDWIRLTELQPRSSDYAHRLGIVEVMLGHKAAALSSFRKALELRPDFSAAINDIVYLLLRDEQSDAALGELDRIGKSFTAQDEIHKFKGQIFLARGEDPAAEAQFRKAVQINPRNYRVYILLAELNLRRNNLPEAIREVDEAIAKNDRFAPAFLQKAYYLQLAGNASGAADNYRKALALDSENALAANNLAWMLCEGNGNLNEALSLARAAKRRLPEDPEIAETLGWVYYRMKNYTLAADQLMFSVNGRKQPSAENYYRLGMALYAKGDTYHAKQTLQKSLELDAKFQGADEARKILKLAS